MADSAASQTERQDGEKPPLTPESVSEKDAAVKEATEPFEAADETGDAPQPHLHAKTFLAVFSVFMIYAAQLFSIVGAGTQGVAISAHFDRSGDVAWVVAPITIMTTVLGPIVSQASDYWGRKWFLIVPTFCGAVGSVIVARATSMSMIIAGTSVIGIAFGAQPLLHTVASEVLPRRYRSWAQSCVMISNVFGAVLGLLVGGSLNRHGNPNGFRSYFYISIGLYLLTAVICIVVYNPLPTKSQTEFTFKEKLAKLDWIGYALEASSLVLFSLGLFWSQNPFPWSDPHVSATFAIGVALGIALVVYETWFRKDGMFHHGLFSKNRNFTVAIVLVFCEGLAFFAANVYFSFETSVLYEKDDLINGLWFAIVFFAMFAASMAIGPYVTLTKKVRWATFLAFVIFTAFFACMASATKDSKKAVWGYPVLLGLGMGMCLILLVTAAQLSTPPELIATASGLIISVRSLGGTVGIAIYNTVFNSAIGHLSSNVAAAAVGAGLPTSSVSQYVAGLLGQNTTELMSTPGVTPAIIGAGADALLDTYAKSFRNVWVTALPFVALAAVAALFFIDPTAEFNNHIDAPVEKDEDLYSIH